MALETGLSSAPLGISLPPSDELPGGPAVVDMLEDGGAEVTFGSEEDSEAAAPEVPFDANLAEHLAPEELAKIATDVIDGYTADRMSRKEWEQTFERGFDLLGLKLIELNEPFEGACSAVHPLIIESAVKFQSKASQELFPAGGPVKTQIVGDASPEVEQQALRVKEYMNYQLTEEMPEYFDELEMLLFALPIIGSCFKKTYWDAAAGRPVSEYVPAHHFFVSYYASNLRRAERYTHVVYRSPNDLRKDQVAGIYFDDPENPLPKATMPQQSDISRKIDKVMGLSQPSDNLPQYTLLEQHVYLDLPGFEDKDATGVPTGIALPYIVTVEEQTKRVLAIRRNWNAADAKREKLLHFTHYKYVPGFGFYGLGLIHLVGNLTMAATVAMRSLTDAGQFATLPGGFKAKGVRVTKSGPIAPGEWRDVEATGMDLAKAIVPAPYKEPSVTLFNMFKELVAAGQKFADTTEQVVADAPSYGPVGTILALLEASTKFFSAVHKRLHKAQRDEFRILARINSVSLQDSYPYKTASADRTIMKSDFDGRVDVLPVSDPNISSQAHRMALGQAIQGLATANPDLYDRREVSRYLLSSLGVQNVDKLMPPPPQAQPADPVTDIMNATRGLPIQAFPGQEHDAHIQVKLAFVQDPANGAHPVMQNVVPILLANIREHVILKYQEQMTGMMQSAMQQGAPPEAMNDVMAHAADQIKSANAAMAQMGGDPAAMLAQAELLDVQVKKQKNEQDFVLGIAQAAVKNREADRKERELNFKALESGVKISADVNKHQKTIDAKLATTAIQQADRAQDRQDKKEIAKATLRSKEVQAANKPKPAGGGGGSK
jgi:hypothetical protein